jgi:hypothetical protein
VPAQSDAPSATWTDAAEERAAIAEYDGGAPRAWAEGFARLDPNKPPSDVPPQRWLRFLEDCRRFLGGGWASRAAELCWGQLDLFGCDRERPFARVDRAGLLWLLNGRKLVAFTADTATIETLSGAHQTYRRGSIAFGEVPWALGRTDSGGRSPTRAPMTVVRLVRLSPIAGGVSCWATPCSMLPSMVTCSAPIPRASTWNGSRGSASPLRPIGSFCGTESAN